MNVEYVKYLRFLLREKTYCVPLNRVKEVVTTTTVTAVPKVSSYFKGVLNLRGQIISVYDLGKKLGKPDIVIVPKKTCIIIFEVNSVTLGAFVDEVISVNRYSENELVKDVTSVTTNIDGNTEGAVKNENGELTLLINIESALDMEVVRRQMEEVI